MMTVQKLKKRAPLKIEVIRAFYLIDEPDPDTGKRARRITKVGETIEVDAIFAFEMIDGGKAILGENRKIA